MLIAGDHRLSAIPLNSCDIFCRVIDNYGDSGVCWRLARQLTDEHGVAVRLWVDDLASFAKLCHDADPAMERQKCQGVELRLWSEPFTVERAAELVIEAFSCKLPHSYLEAMAAQSKKSVWVNLEYLSAEAWVEGCHKLPSPHSSLPLTKYFYFPGFTNQTGGLLLERNLLTRRDRLQSDITQRRMFWQSVGMEMPSAETLKISLFAYENIELPGLLDAWAASSRPVLCLVPEGRILPQIGQYFDDDALCVGKAYSRGNLQIRVLPFLAQEHYDELLWVCDVNFVRGEDSWVRAQWAARPFIWQIYPQQDMVHLKKLEAFLILYCGQLSSAAAGAMGSLWKAWNMGAGAGQAWPAFLAERGELERHAGQWAQQLAKNNLALNLLDFYKEIGRMRALEIEGQ